MMLRGNRGMGYVRLDWFTPDGLGTWGDGRLFVLGTEGYIELRKYADIAGRDDPAIMSFLGFDEASGVILHAHVHFRLVIGTSLLKQYHLPCETGFFARSRVAPGRTGIASTAPWLVRLKLAP